MNQEDYVKFKNARAEDPFNEERSLISLNSTLEREHKECTQCSKHNTERRRLFILIIALIVFFIVITPIIIWLTVHFYQRKNEPQVYSTQQQTGTNINVDCKRNGSYNTTTKEICKSAFDERLKSLERKLSVYDADKKKTFKRLTNMENENKAMKKDIAACLKKENVTAEIGNIQNYIYSHMNDTENQYEEMNENITNIISGVEQQMGGQLMNMSVMFNQVLTDTFKQIEMMKASSSIAAETQKNSFNQKFEALGNQMTALRQQFTDLQNSDGSYTNLSNKTCNLPVAFYAQVAENSITAGGKIVEYSKVVTDTCNSFNKSTGVFTCTIPGVYVFHIFSLDQAKNRANHLLLKKNSEWVAVAWSKAESGYHETTGNSAVLELVEGDEVYVEAGSSHSAQLWKEYSTFSGFMIS